MAGTLKSLLVKLGVDSKDFDKGMDHAEKRSGGLHKAFGNLTKVGMGITAGVAAGIGATAVALASTIQPASDLEEAINAVNVVFGDGAKEITDYGKGAAMAVGLSAREFNQMGAEMGAMLGNVGIAEDQLAGETITLMERASDMASIFNTDVSQAFGAIQSAIKGEFNPLEQFGVKMNQARIDAKALTMGLVETSVDTQKLAEANIRYEKAIIASAAATKKYGEGSLEARAAITKEAGALEKLEIELAGHSGTISDSAKAQAALALVYEQTDKVAGDFQNTSGGLANSQRQLGAWFEDTKAKIGAKLLPALEGILAIGKDMIASKEFEKFLDGIILGVSKLGAWITKTVPVIIENIGKFSNWLKENRGVVVAVFTAMAVAVGAFAISLLPAIWGMITLIAPFLAIAAVAYLVYEAWTNNWGGIQEKTAAAKEFIVGIFQTLTDKIVAIWNTFMTVLNPIIEAFRSAFEGDWYAFGENIREAWDTAWALIATAVSTAWENIELAISEIITNTIAFFTDTDWGEVGKSIIQGIADGLTGAVGLIKTAATNAASAAWSAAKGFLGIHSDSKLFGAMGKNVMVSMGHSIDDFAHVPATATANATRGIAVTAGRAEYQPSGSQQPILDEAKLARMIRDAILKVTE